METMTFKEYLEWLLERTIEKSERDRIKNMIKEID